MIDKKYLIAGAGVLGVVGFLYMRGRNAQEIDATNQAASDVGFPISSMGAYGGGGGGFSIAPASGVGMDTGAIATPLDSGLLSTKTGVLGGVDSGGGMFDYMKIMGELQSKTDIALSKLKLDNSALMQQQYYGGELNLAQNQSLTFLGQSLTNGGDIKFSTDKSGTSFLSINKNLSYAEQEQQRKAASNKSFLDSLYTTIAKKTTPDAGGFAYWEDALQRGSSYSTVAEQFKAAVNGASANSTGTATTKNPAINQSSSGVSTNTPNVTTSNNVPVTGYQAALNTFAGKKPDPSYDAYKKPESPYPSSLTEPMTYKSTGFVGAMPMPQPYSGGRIDRDPNPSRVMP